MLKDEERSVPSTEFTESGQFNVEEEKEGKIKLEPSTQLRTLPTEIRLWYFPLLLFKNINYNQHPLRPSFFEYIKSGINYNHVNQKKLNRTLQVIDFLQGQTKEERRILKDKKEKEKMFDEIYDFLDNEYFPKLKELWKKDNRQRYIKREAEKFQKDDKINLFTLFHNIKEPLKQLNTINSIKINLNLNTIAKYYLKKFIANTKEKRQQCIIDNRFYKCDGSAICIFLYNNEFISTLQDILSLIAFEKEQIFTQLIDSLKEDLLSNFYSTNLECITFHLCRNHLPKTLYHKKETLYNQPPINAQLSYKDYKELKIIAINTVWRARQNVYHRFTQKKGQKLKVEKRYHPNFAVETDKDYCNARLLLLLLESSHMFSIMYYNLAENIKAVRKHVKKRKPKKETKQLKRKF